jgi:hypothetical protein
MRASCFVTFLVFLVFFFFLFFFIFPFRRGACNEEGRILFQLSIYIWMYKPYIEYRYTYLLTLDRTIYTFFFISCLYKVFMLNIN